MNVILQALAHVVPVRDFFLQPAKYEEKVRKKGRRSAWQTDRPTTETRLPPGSLSRAVCSSLPHHHPDDDDVQVERTAQGPLVLRFGEVVRRLWSKDNFKSTVSPHDFLQEAASASKKHFRIGKQGDAIEFLSWLLNFVHLVRTLPRCFPLVLPFLISHID